MTDSFIIEVAQLYVQISGKDRVLLDAWKQLFRHHIPYDEERCIHEVELCDIAEFAIPVGMKLQWTSTLLGVSAKEQLPSASAPSIADMIKDLPDRVKALRATILKNLFGIQTQQTQPQPQAQPQPVYSGSCSVSCYKDAEGREFIVPEKADWRIIHIPDMRITYVYTNLQNDSTEDVVAAMLHVVGSQYGRYLLFASAVEEDGEAVVFIGHGGSGKTTACIERIENGAKYMGDDLVFVYLENGTAMVGSLLFPAKVVTAQTVEKKRMDLVGLPVLQAPMAKVIELTRDHAVGTKKQLGSGDILTRFFDYTNAAHTHDNGAMFVGTLTDIMSDMALKE